MVGIHTERTFFNKTDRPKREYRNVSDILQLSLFGEPEKIKPYKEVDLQTKVRRAIRLLQSVADGYDGEIEVAYSGGKDSDVCLELAKMAGIRYRAIYKNTTIDPAGTIRHAEQAGAEIIRPERPFFKLIEEMGFPNHQQRFCCRFLKEYKVLDKAIMGIRRCESTKRKNNYSEPTECRFYGSKEEHVEAIYPILDWTDKDVVQFIKERGIEIHPLYYRDNGTIDPKRRLGCMCCPLAYYKKRIKAFKQHPNMVKAYIRGGQKFRDTHPDAETIGLYSDVYEWFVRDVFFETQDEWDAHKANEEMSAFGKMDYRKFICEYFNIDLP